jgi:hypothetical protein
VHYIYDSSLSWLDTITSEESSKPMSLWNEAVMQCTIYTYIYNSSLSWLDTRTSAEIPYVLLE